MDAAELKEVLELHAKWLRGESGGQRADLADANLAGADLAGANLAGAYLAGANLAGVYFVGVNLAGANLAGANLAGAYLAGANLAGAYLAGAKVAGANLAGAYLAGAKVTGGTWEKGWPWLSLRTFDAAMVQPGVVRIGCTTLPIAEWLGPKGKRLAVREGLSGTVDGQVLRQWLLHLAAADPKCLGWKPSEGS